MNASPDAGPESLLLALLLMMPRVTGVLLVLPLMPASLVGGLSRNAIILSIALFLTPAAIDSVAMIGDTYRWFGIMVKEVLVGALIGLALGTIFWVAAGVGFLIDNQTGTQNASIFDPMSGAPSGPTSSFLQQFVTVLFLASGGMIALIDLLVQSYSIWPVEKPLPLMRPQVVEFVVQQTALIIERTLLLAAPVIVVLLLLDLGLGIVNRFVPTIDAFTLAMPIKSLAAILMLALFLNFIFDAIGRYFSFSDESLRILIEAFR